MPDEIEADNQTAETLAESASELSDLMDDVVTGNYKPDSFTTQPVRLALIANAKQAEAWVKMSDQMPPLEQTVCVRGDGTWFEGGMNRVEFTHWRHKRTRSLKTE